MTPRQRVRIERLRTWIATLVLCAAPGLAACGSDASSPTTSPAPASHTSAPTTVPPPATATAPARSTSTLAPPTVDPYAGQPLIERVEWTESQDGARLLVFPTRAGRDTTFPRAEERAWAEIRAHSPAAESPGMYDQFVCHWHWARLVQPDKPSWNLEPWRPAVGYEGTVAASCNPGGPER
ncbi:DUF2599 domain-containing protein [Nocardia shimofusensis]|uniref:DUF2599 domain-containing protein n=1 Tax=Nocardia shimofusensis TaxID=228596 RepID=UPI0008307A6E|nr:DUF2599 domain-containing protein [Nocardia shimofusensis]